MINLVTLKKEVAAQWSSRKTELLNMYVCLFLLSTLMGGAGSTTLSVQSLQLDGILKGLRRLSNSFVVKFIFVKIFMKVEDCF